ncbi:MAG: phenylalanine--tRNA ligase subunit beta, partial [Gammaproteobacteria bacterium]
LFRERSAFSQSVQRSDTLMRFSYRWLKEWVDIEVDTQTFADTITMAGLEVDSIEPAAADFSGVVVGEVIDIQPHPDADRLKVCQVDVGQAEPLNIVCGASNVVLGMKAPVALIGARLPGIKKLKASKLRGIKSFGMMCSAEELGMSTESEGLFVLPADAANGQDIRDLLQLDDDCIDVDLTPNRSDCLSISGLAREASTLFEASYRPVEIDPVPAETDTILDVHVEDTAACPRYAGRVIQDIDAAASTPWWIVEKLRRSGIRSISTVVDITNYVMLEIGQPMHAFDLDRLHGGIAVRRANENESLVLLDGKTIDLSSDTLIIADQEGPLALAGIMGGEASGVTEKTHSIFLEAAFFDPDQLSGQARHYGLHTDSSHRFERGVAYTLPEQAIERATHLLKSICGGRPGPVVDITEPDKLPSRTPITLRLHKIHEQLAHPISQEDISRILKNLGMTCDLHRDGWKVTPPDFRFDIQIEADLIEEIARVYGYNRLPSQTQKLELLPSARNCNISFAHRCQEILIQRGYHEAVTYSFIDESLHSLFCPDQPPIRLKNPISDSLGIMRGSLLPGLCQAVGFNCNRQQTDIHLYETGRQFTTKSDGSIEEIPVLAGILTGLRDPQHWDTGSEPADFFDAKSDIEALINESNRAMPRFQQATRPGFHPGQCARITSADHDKITLGWVGKIHPTVARQIDLPENLYFFELYLEELREQDLTHFQPLPRFPTVSRDLAILADQHLPSDELLDTLRQTAGKKLVDCVIFDVYRGKNIHPGQKSIAIRLTFQDFSRTLEEEEINTIINEIVNQLEVRNGAKLRD